MNKKAVETTMFNVIIGILIAVVLSLILINLIGKFISNEGSKEESTSYFYFTKLAEDLTKMSIGDVKNSTFLTNKELTLITFNREDNDIKKSDVSLECLKYPLQEDIKKPIKCRDKNCLCLCQTDFITSISGEFYSPDKLKIDCEAEESRCVELPLIVNTQNSCKNLMIYSDNEILYDLELKKEMDAFLVKVISKTL